MVEQLIRNEKVGCSIHLSGTTYKMPDLLRHFSFPAHPQYWRGFAHRCEIRTPGFSAIPPEFAPIPFSVLCLSEDRASSDIQLCKYLSPGHTRTGCRSEDGGDRQGPEVLGPCAGHNGVRLGTLNAVNVCRPGKKHQLENRNASVVSASSPRHSFIALSTAAACMFKRISHSSPKGIKMETLSVGYVGQSLEVALQLTPDHPTAGYR